MASYIANKFKLCISKRRKLIVISMSVFFTLFLFCSYFAMSVNPIIKDTIEIKSKALATRAMNSAISDVVMNSVVYEDLIHIVSDELGNISMIQANSLEINNLSRDLAQMTEQKIEEYGRRGVKIPLGSFSGIPILVGQGPSIGVKVSPVGAVSCEFSSQFQSAGINQTNHKIYLSINADIGVVMPLFSSKFRSSQQVLISESILIGQVPEVYLYSDSLDTLLNFVPY